MSRARTAPDAGSPGPRWPLPGPGHPSSPRGGVERSLVSWPVEEGQPLGWHVGSRSLCPCVSVPRGQPIITSQDPGQWGARETGSPAWPEDPRGSAGTGNWAQWSESRLCPGPSCRGRGWARPPPAPWFWVGPSGQCLGILCTFGVATEDSLPAGPAPAALAILTHPATGARAQPSPQTLASL